MEDEPEKIEAIDSRRIGVGELHDNRTQTEIWITEDRLHLILNRLVTHMNKSRDWVSPLAIALAVLITFVSANFQDQWGLSADNWELLLGLVGIAAVVWFVVTLYRAWRGGSTEDRVTLTVEECKGIVRPQRRKGPLRR